MKRLILLLSLLLIGLPIFAEEDLQTVQLVENENTFLGANFQKAPAQPNGKQTITNHKSFLCINIIVNGKIKQPNPTEK